MPFKLNFDEIIDLKVGCLYKFKAFDTVGLYKTILKNQLYLASRTMLNDPKDCRIQFN